MNWYLTQILLAQFLTVSKLIVMCMISDIRWERIASFISSKGIKAGSKDEADGQGCQRLQQNWKFWERQHYFHIYLQAYQHGKNSHMQQVSMNKTSSLLRQDISEQPTLLDCMWKQNDSQTSELPYAELYLNCDCGLATGDFNFQNHKTSQ